MNEMPAKQPQITEVRAELRHYLLSLAIVLNDFYGDHALSSLLDKAGSGAGDYELLESADVQRFRLCRLLPDAYDYAFNGRVSDIMEVQAYESPSYFDQLTDFLAMVEGNSLIEVVSNDIPQTDEIWQLGGLRILADTGRARACLDEGLPLDAREVALLAGISERSVQNAFSLKGPGRLQAKKAGGVSSVDAADAARWLADKKGFVPTTRIRIDISGAQPAALNTPTDLRMFLGAMLSRRFGDDLRRASESSGIPEDSLARMSAGEKPIDLTDAIPLARAFKVDVRWFVDQVFRNRFPKEFAVLHGE